MGQINLIVIYFFAKKKFHSIKIYYLMQCCVTIFKIKTVFKHNYWIHSLKKNKKKKKSKIGSRITKNLLMRQAIEFLAQKIRQINRELQSLENFLLINNQSIFTSNCLNNKNILFKKLFHESIIPTISRKKSSK